MESCIKDKAESLSNDISLLSIGKDSGKKESDGKIK